jgi:putative copper export protein
LSCTTGAPVKALSTPATGARFLLNLVIFIGLLALGGFNHFVMRWRLETSIADQRSRAERQRFRRIIATEFVLGLALLVATAILVGLPRTREG